MFLINELQKNHKKMGLLYSCGQAKPTNKNGNFLMATKYLENVQIC